MDFAVYPLRFEFHATEPLFFAPGMASNTLRGGLGVVFRRLACNPSCRGPKTCEIRHSCPYARVFEPAAANAGPSGLADSPRPFVFRARNIDGRTIQPGESFSFDLHVFSLDCDMLAWFILSFASLAREGLGPGRSRIELQRVSCLHSAQILFEHSAQIQSAALAPLLLDLTPPGAAPTRIRVNFLSPTELKHQDGIASRPEFPILFSRVRDRIATLRRLYGAGPLDIDYRGTNARAATVNMISCTLRRDEHERRSTRTGQAHPLGGFLGSAEYEGDLDEFLPFLLAAKWTGVGRHAVWGKGEIDVEIRGAATGLS